MRVRNNIWPASDTGASMELGYSTASHRGYIQVYDRTSGGQEWGQLYLGAGHVGIGTSVEYSKLTAVLIQGVKELRAENQALSARLEAIEGRER